jgi:cation diffusion facilitator CzcD-associated flavoprotein CzcO
LSNDYYPALQRSNTELVTDPIREVTSTGITTEDGREHGFDAIVLATGFQAAEMFAPFATRGRGGQELGKLWKQGAEAYLGTVVSGFPNFFMLVGPNTGLGHNSLVYMIESQIAYVLDALRTLRERDLKTLEVQKPVQDAFNRRLRGKLARTVWATGGCQSWYQTRTGKITTLWPGFTFAYRWRLRRFDLHNYAFEPLSKRESAPVAEHRSMRPRALS